MPPTRLHHVYSSWLPSAMSVVVLFHVPALLVGGPDLQGARSMPDAELPLFQCCISRLHSGTCSLQVPNALAFAVTHLLVLVLSLIR